MLRILIADDEEPARAKLRRYLGEVSDVILVGEADNGHSTVEQVLALRPDVLFIDVQMPDVDGFGVVAALPPAVLPTIVFITAHDKYAVQAFEVNAFDYLLKPVSPERFIRLITRLQTRPPTHNNEQLEAQLSALLNTLPQPQHFTSHLLLENQGRAQFISTENITYIEADRNYLAIHAKNETYRLRGTLEQLSKKLDPAHFLRVNRSMLVRIAAVSEIIPWPEGEYRLLLEDGSRITWTRHFVKLAPNTLLRKL